jgi:hypothetical protein
MDVEAVREHQRCALFQVFLEVCFVKIRLVFVWGEDHHDICIGCGFCRFHDFQASGFGFGS